MVAPAKLPDVIAARYRPIRLIATGGMGAVYEVEHVATGERLALKILAAGADASSATLERFKHEVRASARIKSEHVVRVIDADVAPELGFAPFLVMELLEGTDLERAAASAPLAPATVVDWLRQAARAIDKAHRMGIVHRDLKPENIFLARGGDGQPVVKILDFGIVKMVEEGTGLTGTGQIIGTPRYMAPEQLSSGGRITPATDRCALGLVAHRLLVGESYYQGGVMVILGQILHDELQLPSQRGSRLGSAFDAWFLKACHRDPEQRFATAAEQVEALAEALALPRQPIETVVADAPWRKASERGTWRRPVLLTLGLVTVLAAVAVVVVVKRSSHATRPAALVCGLPSQGMADACAACMARACCAEAEECGSSEDCTRLEACLSRCGSGDSPCRARCMAEKAAAASLEQGVDACRSAHCTRECHASPWACLGKVEWRASRLTPPSIRITTSAVCPSCGTGGGAALLSDVRVRVCSIADPGCELPLSESVTDGRGAATLTVDATVYPPPLAVFLEYRRSGYLDTLFMVNAPPLSGDRDIPRVFLLDPRLNLTGAAATLGTTYDPTRAHVMVTPTDCDGSRATDRVEITWLDRDERSATMPDFVYTRAAMAMNLPINAAFVTRILAHAVATKQLMAATSAIVRPRALTLVHLPPMP